MKTAIYLTIITMLLSCSNKENLPILRTNSKAISIQDGNDFNKDIWTISSEIELDEFITNKFYGEKEVSFISDLDTLKFNVTPNNIYDFVIQYNQEKAFTRINTDTLKKASIPSKKILEYYYDDKSRNYLTDTISFRISKINRIHFNGKINNSENLDFLFDTGANGNSLTKSTNREKVNLELDGTVTNLGSDGTSINKTSSNNKLSLGYLNWDNVNFRIRNSESKHFEGLLGWIIFENKIVEIDYENNIFIIHKSMKTVSKDYSQIETKMIRGVPYIKGQIITNDTKSEGWFEYDSGFNGSFSLSQKFATENNLNNAMKKVGTSVSSGSTGIEWKANEYILPKLKFGEFEISNVPISIDEKDPEGIEHNDILGNNLLKRFNAIIDFKNFEIYLKPNHLLNAEY